MRRRDQRLAAAEVRASYHTLLRAVGHLLDSQHGHDVQVLELPDEMMVQFTRRGEDMRRQVVHLRHAELLASGRILEQLGWHPRRVRTEGSRRKYEELLAALGSALDQADAEMMALEELGNGGILLTYQLVVPHGGYVPRKQHVVLDRDAQQRVVQAAAARRGPTWHGLFGARAR